MKIEVEAELEGVEIARRDANEFSIRIFVVDEAGTRWQPIFMRFPQNNLVAALRCAADELESAIKQGPTRKLAAKLPSYEIKADGA